MKTSFPNRMVGFSVALALSALTAHAAPSPKFTTLTNSMTPVATQPIRVKPLPGWNSGTSTILPQEPVQSDEESRRLGTALRAAQAQQEAIQLMTPEQREALKALERSAGAAIQVRLRPGTGTPRYLALPKNRMAKLAAVAPDPEATTAAFLQTNRELLLLNDPDLELQLTRKESDELGYTHLRFSQRYQGLAVWPADLNVHVNRAGEVELLDGAFVATPLGVPTVPTVDSDKALGLARAAVPAGARGEAGGSQLIVYAPGDKPPRLAWKMDLTIGPEAHWLVLIDALDGATLNAFNQVMHENVAGSGVDLLNKTRALNVWHANGQYYLVDTSKPMFDASSTPPANAKGAIAIMDGNHQTLPDNGNITVYQITSSSPATGWMADGVSAAFDLSETFDYYRTHHNRNSIDGQGGTMTGIVRYSQDYKNAFWSGQAMFFGDAEPYAGAIDVVGHELTHGVTQHTANLLYQDQSGAMNEAMSDIFGEMVEAYARGTNDWLMGKDLGNPLRSMSDPSSLEIAPGHRYPSKMSEFLGPNDPVLDNFQNRDSGGVHINSVIISHAFYLLVTTGEGMPPTNAAAIFYRALTTHLTSQSQFLDCRIACLSSAKEIFGDTAPEVQKTADAFDAVEIFDGASQPAPPQTPAVTGADSALFVYYDANESALYLARKEDAKGDPSDGVSLSLSSVAQERPSVAGNGAAGIFVTGFHDAALIPTDGSDFESTLGYPGQIGSVAMAPDGQHYAFVLQNASGQRQNKITYIDTTGSGTTKTITLTAPSDAGPVNTIYYADTLCFTPDNRYIVFDALNQIQISGGTNSQVWSIYAYDLQANRTVTIVSPSPGMDVGNPCVGRTDGSLITFEARNQQTAVSQVVAANLRSGDAQVIGSVNQLLAWPCYNGDDTAIAYAQADSSVPTGESIVKQPLAADHITPAGTAAKWVSDATSGFVYRRGTYTAPSAPKNSDLSIGVAGTPDPVVLGNNVTFTVTVTNLGPDDATGVILVNTLPDNATFVSGTVSQGTGSRTNNRVTCVFGTVARGATASATIVATTTAAGETLNSASVVSDQGDPNPANNNASGSVTTGSGTQTATLVVQVSPAGAGSATGGGTYPVGSQQQISATANAGWAFAQWQDGNAQNPRMVTVPSGGTQYTATFTNTTTAMATLVVQVSPAGAGTATGGGTYPVGSQQQISATANPGWGFAQWQDGNTQNPRTVSVGAGGTKYTATFTNAPASEIAQFSNSAKIIINDNSPATPYPSTISISSRSGPIKSVTVSLHGLTHGWPQDLGILLVGPAGQTVALLANAGAGTAIANLDLTFDDSTANALSDTDPITSGTFRPSNLDGGDAFASPAPAGPYGANLQSLVGTDPNGTWSLFVHDDQPGESGQIAAGWTLSLGLSAAPAQNGAVINGYQVQNGVFQFTLTGSAGTNYAIQASSDLMTWKTLRTVSLLGTTTNIQDSSAGLRQRFYRTKVSP